MKKQGYKSRDDERLGMKDGKASSKKQGYKARRDESAAMQKKAGKSPMGLKAKVAKKK